MKHIYFVGIGGAGLSALAQLAQDAGYNVSGSDQEESQNTLRLEKRGISVSIGQSGKEIAAMHNKQPIDWLVVSSSIKADHKEIEFAKKHKIEISKRDGLINSIIKDKKLKLLAISGTHGKTTTTAMVVWLFKQMRIPVSYIVGTNISFGSSGQYQEKSEYLVLEADEFDRHMLSYRPFCSILPSVEYDHPDTYKTVDDYKKAFCDFVANSHCAFTWEHVAKYLSLTSKNLHLFNTDDTLIGDVALPGAKNRENAFLAMQLFHGLFPKLAMNKIISAINAFPGTERRMEKLANNLYSDYAHHPTEIAATIGIAKEINPKVVIFYQPHQNIRQHEIQDKYGNCFMGVEKVYWLPTYLSREDSKLKTLSARELINQLSNPRIAESAEMNDDLVQKINKHRKNGELVIIMGAGSIDPWARKNVIN